MSTSICPICGKAGIPDFQKEDVVCPNCNSDLSIYRNLQEVADGGGYSKNNKLAIILPIAAVLLVCIVGFVFLNKEKNAMQQQLKEANNTIAELRGKDKSSNATQQHQIAKEQLYIEYYVQLNDSPWRIVQKFFGVRSDWQNISRNIAERNGIWDAQKETWVDIHPGQVIRIYNIQ
jgi:hypothetical protein